MTASPADAPLLDVRGLEVTFPTPRGALRALDGVSFSVPPGRALALVGESGSGKSVTAKAIMNLLPSTATIGGEVWFDGREIRALPKAETRHLLGVDVAMIFQDPMTALNPVKRIGAQLTEHVRYHKGLSRTDARDRAIEVLERVNVPAARTRLRQYPHELSGGLRQRMVIAMALACGPKLLIADEPTTALDVTVQKQILDLLDELRADLDMTMILITHDLGVAFGRCDEIAVMYAGRAVERVVSSRILDHMQHPYTEALLDTIPKVENAPHTRLDPIPGRPPDLTRPPAGCRFAPRCRYAQSMCLTDDPALRAGGSLGDAAHLFACHLPVGSEEGQAARSANASSGTTAAGLVLNEAVTA